MATCFIYIILFNPHGSIIIITTSESIIITTSVSLTDFAKIQEAKGQNAINTTSQCKAPGTFYCTMLPPSGKEIGNKSYIQIEHSLNDSAFIFR